MSNWISIDFGNSNTRLAIIKDGQPIIVRNGNSLHFPTIGCIMPEGDIKVCQYASGMLSEYPDRYMNNFKDLISGQLNVNGKEYVDIVAEILKFGKATAESVNNGKTISSVVLSIPSEYTVTDPKIEVMKEAAKNAGFTDVETISEAQSAVKYYVHITGNQESGLSLVYHLGDQKFTATLIDGDNNIVCRKAITQNGGQYFDSIIYHHINKQYKLDSTKKIDDFLACKKIKETLSTKESASQYFSNGETVEITRSEFNGLIDNKMQETIDCCDQLLQTGHKQWSDIKQVLLIGGSTLIPLVKELLTKHLKTTNASSVKVVSNSNNNKYQNQFAVCLGGIVSKIPKPIVEVIAKLMANGRTIQLKQGVNIFGRDPNADFSFEDQYMSRKHFQIEVIESETQGWTYRITALSSHKATTVGMVAIGSDCLTNSIVINPRQLKPNRIVAGKTEFEFISQ